MKFSVAARHQLHREATVCQLLTLAAFSEADLARTCIAFKARASGSRSERGLSAELMKLASSRPPGSLR